MKARPTEIGNLLKVLTNMWKATTDYNLRITIERIISDLTQDMVNNNETN